MRGASLSQFGVLIMVSLILGVVGCGNSGKAGAESFNGAWQNPSNQQKIVLNLNGEKQTILVDGQTLPITIKEYETDRYSFRISDPASGDKEWKVFRIWDDNGSSFSMKLERDGKTELLDRVAG
jgi:hypothetical protein